MNSGPRRPGTKWRRPAILALLGAVLIGWALKQTVWRYPTRIYDEAGVLDREQQFLANMNYAQLTKDEGIDVRVIITRSLGDQALPAFALDRMRGLGIGESTDRRGLLVVLDLGGKQVRLEVGPTLEFLFTDAYSSYLAHDLIGPMLATDAAPMRVLSALLHALRFRVDGALLGQEWDPALVSAIRERQRLALGGGADAVAQLADLHRLANQPATAGVAARYGAQATAADALARYLEWVQEPFAYVDVGLVSAGSRDVLTDINGDVSVGAWRFDQLATLRERYTLVEREGRAIAIPTVSPLSHPAWFVRGRHGWQMELLPEFLILRSVLDEPWRWTILTPNDPWIRIFGDLLEVMPGSEVVRFRDGNNTPIPGRGQLE